MFSAFIFTYIISLAATVFGIAGWVGIANKTFDTEGYGVFILILCMIGSIAGPCGIIASIVTAFKDGSVVGTITGVFGIILTIAISIGAIYLYKKY